MKFLKKFNEELSPYTYKSAASKLKKLGHERRASELEKWGKELANKESMEKWEINKEKFSKWGKATIKFLKNKQEVFRGDFYLLFTFDDYAHKDSIGYMKDSSKGYFDFNISFAVGAIPVDDETLQLCLKNFPDEDFSNGFFWSMWVNIYYKVENERLSFNKITYYPYDESVTLDPHLVDRRGALTLKKHIMACFDENDEYPSDDTREAFMYDLVFKTLCQELELTVDYNFHMDRALNDIKGYSHNYFFKD
jgi:hypothetical protein